MKRAYDVTVAYRIYPQVSKVPAVFPKDKLRLASVCLRSFRESLGAVRAKIFVLLDGCPDEFGKLFRDTFDSSDLEIIRLSGIGNLQTFSRQIDILTKQDFAESVYFAEDDYFYLPGKFGELLQFLENNHDADFVSPYDHPDYYSRAIHSERQAVRVVGDYKWHTAASTCLTFLTSKRTLIETRKIFRTYTYHNPDVCLWLSLTKQAVFSPQVILKSFRERIASGGFIVASWLYGWPQILAGRRRKLWVPSPSIATHTEQRFLAPDVDWNAYFEAAIKTV